MILNSKLIKQALRDGLISIEPYEESMLENSSYGIRLSSKLKVPINGQLLDLEVSDELEFEEFYMEQKGFILEPHTFILGQTIEIVGLTDNISAWVDGRMKLAIAGVSIHQASSFCDPGRKNALTLEIYNASVTRVRLYPGLRVGAVIFESNSDDFCWQKLIDGEKIII